MFIETFTAEETAILDRYFTNTDLPVFCLVNMPEVTKAALFARYSRTGLSLRRLFLDEFWDGDNEQIYDNSAAGRSRSDALFEKVLDQYGDDSVAQLGGAHIACEGVSNILTKLIERPRLAAYLEQSTRYINFADKPGGSYRYVNPEWGDPVVAGVYETYMDGLFGGYASLVQLATDLLIDKHDASTGPEKAAVRAQALDACRGLLPAGTTSNLGMYASGQAYAGLVIRLMASDLPEARAYGAMMLTELRKVIPQFLKRVDREDRGARHGQYMADTRTALADAAAGLPGEGTFGAAVKLVSWTLDAELEIAAAALYPHARNSMEDLRQMMLEIPGLLDSAFDAAVGDRSANYRHKPGRGFEHANYTFDILSDYGAFRDLQRHRMLTIDWQPLTPALGFDVPEVLADIGLSDAYAKLMGQASAVFARLAEASVEQARYVVPLGYKIRYMIKANARALTHMLELRTTPQAHPVYRTVCQQMFTEIRDTARHQRIASAMSHVQLGDVELARLESEKRLAEQKQQT